MDVPNDIVERKRGRSRRINVDDPAEFPPFALQDVRHLLADRLAVLKHACSVVSSEITIGPIYACAFHCAKAAGLLGFDSAFALQCYNQLLEQRQSGLGHVFSLFLSEDYIKTLTPRHQDTL